MFGFQGAIGFAGEDDGFALKGQRDLITLSLAIGVKGSSQHLDGGFVPLDLDRHAAIGTLVFAVDARRAAGDKENHQGDQRQYPCFAKKQSVHHKSPITVVSYYSVNGGGAPRRNHPGQVQDATHGLQFAGASCAVWERPALPALAIYMWFI